MAEAYDIAVIGTGPGGYIAALKAAQMGAAVAAVEEKHLGGTCLNWGCIPSKALLASAQRLHEIRQAGNLGIQVDGRVGFDWPKIQHRKDGILRQLRGGIQSLFGARNVALLRGRAVLDGPGRIVVAGEGGRREPLAAKGIILAVGSVPSRIPGWPTDGQTVCTSDEALHWEELPSSVLIVGGGVIGCEFACMLQPFGAEVTIVEMMPRLLPEMDADLGAGLAKVFAQRKIACFTDTMVQDLAVSGGRASATLSNGRTVQADKVLVATGRRPNTADIGLQSVGLTTDNGFIRVGDDMATSAGGIYCVGDANGRCLLAHAASAQAAVAVANALGRRRTFDAPIPTTVYTFPEIAAVGLTHEQARKRGMPVAVGTFPIGHLGKALAVGDREGFVKVLRHRETGLLLGVHMMGHNVTECIAAAAAMIGRRAAVQDVAEAVVAHPTIGEALKEAAEDALGMALHLPPRKVIRLKA